ncbi:MAG: hypothetical protein ACLQGJ_05505 [Candidatus Dormibacteria bacterium]
MTAEDVTTPSGGTTPPVEPYSSSPASSAEKTAPAEAHNATEEAPSAAEAASPGAGAVILSAPEIRQFAGELATQLFQRWESALQQQFQAELSLRLEAELKHREHEARVLREEVQERRALWEGMWSVKHPRGLSTDTVRWEMEQTIRRQAAELAETERQMRELHERLRDLGDVPDEITVTVDAQSEFLESEEPAE